MADPTAQQPVAMLAALAQATRLDILARVAEAGAKGVAAGDIARTIRCPPSTLSFHLKELSRTGLLEAHPRGRFVIYSLRREALDGLARYIAGLAGVEPATRTKKAPAARGAQRRAAGNRGQLSMFGD